MNFSVDMHKLGYNAATAAQSLAIAGTNEKNEALAGIAAVLTKMKSFIMDVNAKEVSDAKGRGLPAPMIDRMTLTEARFDEMIQGIHNVIELPDPVGRILDGHIEPSGLNIIRRAVPLGVVGVIYESRPNVTVDIAALCIKSGNACILRGGSECFQTNLTMYELIQEALTNSAIPASSVNLVTSTERELVNQMLTLSDFIDVIIPRGGEALHRMCVKHATVPVITGGFGVSHIYVDNTADIERSVDIIINAKTQKPSACNALDTLLIHCEKASTLLHNLAPELEKHGVYVHAHGVADELLRDYPFKAKCSEADFDTEFLGLHMNVMIVESVSDAILHIRKHKAIHSDAILTETIKNAKIFERSVPSACVYINCSTRFSDGGQFGMGAEVAISTQKLHARGPMALEALTTYQYVCQGDYLVRK